MGHKDLKLGQIVQKLVFHNISFSWLPPQDGFQFIFLLRDSDEQKSIRNVTRNHNINRANKKKMLWVLEKLGLKLRLWNRNLLLSHKDAFLL